MQDGILAVDVSTEQSLDVNVNQTEHVAQFDVYWQDEVTLNLDMSLMYIVSGQQELQDYVDKTAKPSLKEYIDGYTVPIVQEIVDDIARPVVKEYLEDNAKPAIEALTEEKILEINEAYAQSTEDYNANAAEKTEIVNQAAALATEQASIATEQAVVATEKAQTATDTLATFEQSAEEKLNQLEVDLSAYYTKEEVDQAIESATPDMSADKVEYNNGSITNVQQALDQLLYVSPNITSFSGGGTYEVGQSISSINFAWALNKTVTSQSINQGIGTIDPSARSYAYTPSTPIRSNITYTLTVGDGKNTATKSTSLAFRYKRYWGVSSKDTLTNADILALSKELTTGRTQSRTFNCSGGKYFYFVIPAEFCSGISFKVGGLAFSDMDVKDITLTNESGATVACKVYRSKNLQTGSAISVEVL